MHSRMVLFQIGLWAVILAAIFSVFAMVISIGANHGSLRTPFPQFALALVLSLWAYRWIGGPQAGPRLIYPWNLVWIVFVAVVGIALAVWSFKVTMRLAGF